MFIIGIPIPVRRRLFVIRSPGVSILSMIEQGLTILDMWLLIHAGIKIQPR